MLGDCAGSPKGEPLLSENIPLTELLDRARSWSPRERIITVCAKGGGRSAQAAQVLRDIGFGRTWWLCGGTMGWR